MTRGRQQSSDSVAQATISLPRYVIRRHRGGRDCYYFQVPKRVRPATWTAGAIRLSDDPAEAARQGRELNAQLDAARQDAQAGPPRGSLPHVLQDYHHSERYRDLAPDTKRGYDQLAGVLLKWSTQAGDPPMRTITRPAILKFLDLYRDRPSHRKHLARFMSVLFRHAMDIGEASENPATNLGLKEPKSTHYAWTDADVDAVVRAADEMGRPSVGTAVLLAADLGQRPTDVLRLRWGHHYRDGVFRFAQSKTGTKLEIPATTRLRERLAATTSDSLYLVARERDGQPYQTYHFQHLFRAVANQAGLPKHARFQHLRHYAVVTLAGLGFTGRHIATITGHSQASVDSILDRHYWHRDSDQARQVVERLDAHRKGQKGRV